MKNAELDEYRQWAKQCSDHAQMVREPKECRRWAEFAEELELLAEAQRVRHLSLGGEYPEMPGRRPRGIGKAARSIPYFWGVRLLIMSK